jgi:hypothetical protein
LLAFGPGLFEKRFLFGDGAGRATAPGGRKFGAGNLTLRGGLTLAGASLRIVDHEQNLAPFNFVALFDGYLRDDAGRFGVNGEVFNRLDAAVGGSTHRSARRS